MKKCYIYSLVDPITDEVKYIGKTKNPKKRFNAHLSECKIHFWTKKNKWLLSLLNDNFKPKMIILEETTEEKINELEIKYIKKYENLTNSTEGGDGGWDGLTHNEKSIEKMRKSHNKWIILQFDLDNNFIDYYNSAEDAGLFLKFDYRTIMKCCKGKILAFNGYYFRFSNNFFPYKLNKPINMEEIHKICLEHADYKSYNLEKQELLDNRRKEKKERIKKILPKYIEYDLEGNVIKIHNTLSEAIKLSGCHPQLIINCCKNKSYYTVNNRTFRYEGDLFDYVPYNKSIQKTTRKVCKYTLDGILVEEFDSIKKACIEAGISENGANISNCCHKKYNKKGKSKVVKGFTYRFSEDSF